jgi:hypothetical protein
MHANLPFNPCDLESRPAILRGLPFASRRISAQQSRIPQAYKATPNAVFSPAPRAWPISSPQSFTFRTPKNRFRNHLRIGTQNALLKQRAYNSFRIRSYKHEFG